MNGTSVANRCNHHVLQKPDLHGFYHHENKANDAENHGHWKLIHFVDKLWKFRVVMTVLDFKRGHLIMALNY